MRGARPVQWLLDNADVDENWCLVHATHMDAKETKALAKSNAVVSICPSTEANLGDGIFPLKDYLKHKGRWAVGSDSNVSVSVVEELRWLEYGQRLKHQQRNLVAGAKQPNVGTQLLAGAAAGGWQASGVEARDDCIELDGNAPALFGASAAGLGQPFHLRRQPAADPACHRARHRARHQRRARVPPAVRSGLPIGDGPAFGVSLVLCIGEQCGE